MFTLCYHPDKLSGWHPHKLVDASSRTELHTDQFSVEKYYAFVRSSVVFQLQFLFHYYYYCYYYYVKYFTLLPQLVI